MIFALLALLFATSSSARAQDDAIENIYSAGVQAYYGGDYSRCFELLTQAVAAKTDDPRVYYFRGLSAMYIGGDPNNDFTAGAKLEASDAGGYEIGRALERVQGRARLLLERYRAQGRLQAAQARDRERLQHYQAVPVPFRGAPLPETDAPAAPVKPAAPAAPPAGKAPDDPFAAPPAAAPKAPAAPADDPFAPPK
jgi:hypothetical protein